MASDLDPIYQAAAQEWNVDPALLRAVSSIETGGTPNPNSAVSPKGAQGLMQIMPGTQTDLGVTDPNDPKQSIYGGAKYLSQMLDRYHTPELALAAYNAGPDRVDKHLATGAPLPAETQAYVPSVTKRYQAITTPAMPAASTQAPSTLTDPSAQPPVPPGWGAGHIGDTGRGAYPAAMMATPQGRAAAAAAAAADRAGAAAAAAQYGWDPTGKIQPDLGGGNFPIPPIPPANPNAPTPEPVSPDDPFTAALKAASQPVVAPATSDPFSAALTAAQKEVEAARPPDVPNPNAGLNEFGITDDPQQFNNLKGVEVGQPVANVAKAAIQGYQDTSPILTPQAQQFVDQSGPIGRYITNPLLHIAGAVPAAANALGSGVAQAITEGAQAAGQPALGRDLNMLAQVAPFARVGTGLPLTAAAATEAPEAAVSPHQQALNSQADALAARRPGQLPAPNPLAASAPAFVPPGSNVPILQQIRQLIDADDKVAANKPAFIPPDATQPPNPLSLPKTVPPAFDNALAVPKSEPQPTPATVAPQSVGAAASREMATGPIPEETPEQKLTNLGKSVTQSAEDRAGPQLQDNNIYVPNVERPLAAREFSPQNSLDDKTLRAADPVYRAQQEGIERTNNQTMVDLLSKDAGDANALKTAHDDRAEVAPPAQQLFDNEKPVDAAPLVNQIDSTLAGPDGKRAAVVRTLTAVKNSLFDGDGNLETLPSQLYGARKNITDFLRKGVGEGADDVRASKSILTGLLDKIDPIINGGAPKYQTYLDQFHEASQPINQMEFLQKYQTGPKNLTGVDGYLQLKKVQKMLDDIYQGQKVSGINPAKSLTDDQVQNIVSVRNELAAQSLKDRLASVKGSDTTQQMNRAGVLGDGPIGTAVKGAAEMGAHALLFHTTGGIGNAAMAIHRSVIKPAREASKAVKQENVLAARKAALLNTKPNPLAP